MLSNVDFCITLNTINRSIFLHYSVVSALIQPTSTENERVFSIASNFCTKLHSSVKFDTLVFLKYYLIKKF